MRMRRIMAFVLAVVMLMSNTVTASATSASSTPISGNYNITTGENGETIISPIDEEEQDELSDEEQEVTPPSDNGDEPSGEDAGTGDEGLGDDSNNDDLGSGEEGGDIDESNAPAEGEEITTEETTTEELLAPGPLYDGETTGTEGDTSWDNGEVVSLYFIIDADDSSTVTDITYYKTLAAAVQAASDFIEENVGKTVSANINLTSDPSGATPVYSVAGNDLVASCADSYSIYISASSATIDVVGDANINTTVKLHDGGSLKMEKDATLTVTGCVYGGTVDFSAGGGKLILGTEGIDESAGWQEFDIEGTVDLTVNGNLHFEPLTTDSKLVVDELDINLKEGLVERDGYSFYEAQFCQFKLPIEARTLAVDIKIADPESSRGFGKNIAVATGGLNVTGSVSIADGTMVMLRGETILNNVKIIKNSAGETSNSGAELILARTYDESGVKEETQKASLELNGAVTCEESKYPLKVKAARMDDGYGGWPDYVNFDVNEVIATIDSTMSSDTDLLSKLGFMEGAASISNNQIISNGGYKYELECNNNWQNKLEFYSLQAVKDYIRDADNSENQYRLCIPGNTTLDEDLDFSGFPYNQMIFDLNGSVLTIDKDTTLCVSMVCNGNVEVKNGATLTLIDTTNIPYYRDTIAVNRVDIAFDENYATGGLVINSEETMDSGYACMDVVKITGLENKSLTVYGELAYNDMMLDDQLYYGNILVWENGYQVSKNISDYTLSVGELNIYNGSYINSMGYEIEQRTAIHVPVIADEITLDGRMEVYSVSANKKFTSYWGSDLVIYEDSEISNLNVKEDKNEKYCKYLNIQKHVTYLDTDTEKKNPVADGIIIFNGTVEGFVSLSKWEKTVKENGSESWSSLFNIDETAGLIDVSNSQTSVEDILAHFSVESYYQPLVLQPEVLTDNANIYEMKVYSDANDVRLYDADGLNRGFASLADVQAYIVKRNKKNANYRIYLNKNLAVYGDELVYDTTYAEGVELYLNNHSITFTDDCTVKLDGIHGKSYNEEGESIEQPNSKLSIGKNTVTFLPRRQWDESDPSKETTISDLTIVSDKTTPGSLVLGDANANDIINSNIHFTFVSFTNKLKDLSLYGNVEFINDSTLTVTNQIYVKNVSDESRDIWQEAYLDGWVVTTKNLDAREGQVALGAFEVTGTSSFMAGNSLTVLPISYTELNNIVIDADANDAYMPFNIDFRTPIYLNNEDCVENPNFDNGEKLDYGHLTINGTVTTNGTMYNPIGVNRYWYCDWDWNEYDEEDNFVDFHHGNRSEQEPFEAGETILIATNAATTAKYFSIQGDNSCTKKVGNLIVADKIRLEVIYDDESLGEEDPRLSVCYTSLEDAVVNMPTDFDKAVGNYTFIFLENMMLNKEVTIPSFVTGLNLATGEEGNGTYYRRYLDLNGKKITTSACVNLSEGLRINSFGENGTALQGQLVINAVSDEEPVLNIGEDRTLVDYNENGELVELIHGERDAVLRNVLVTAVNGGVNLWCLNEVEEGANDTDNRDNKLYASFETRGFFVDGGSWVIGDEKSHYYIKTTDFRVNGTNVNDENRKETDPITEDAHLNVSQITITNGNFNVDGNLKAESVVLSNTWAGINGYVETDMLSMSKGSIGEVWNEFHAGSVTMDQSKLLIGPENEGNAYIGNLMVKSAYAGDAMGDYTVQNNSRLSVSKLEMAAGTFANFGTEDETRGTVEADTVKVKDFIAGEHTSFICNTFTNTGKATFYCLGRLLINGNDTAKDAEIEGTLNNVYLCGYGTGENEYALIGRGPKADVNLTGTFTIENEGQRALGFVSEHYLDTFGDEEEDGNWDRVWLSIMDGQEARFEELEQGEVLFQTSIKAFPTDNIRVLDYDYLQADGDGVTNNAIYQDGTNLRVIGEYIRVLAKTADGSDEILLDSFTTWADAVAYINTVANVSTKYAIRIACPELTVSGTLDMPKNVAALFVEAAEDIEQVTLNYTGDIKLNTNTAFQNIALKSTGSTIATNGKVLRLGNVSADLKTISGSQTTEVYVVEGSEITTSTKLNGLGTLIVAYGSSLDVTGGIVVTNLNIGFGGDNDTVSEVVTDGAVTVTDLYINKGELNIAGEKSALKINGNMTLNSAAALKTDGTIAVAKDIYSNADNNHISMAKAGTLTITGRVLTNNAPDDMVTVEMIPVEGGYNFKGEEKIADITYPLMKNAISVSIGDGVEAEKNGTVIAVAEKVSPTWFAIYSEKDGVAYKNLASKNGKNIVCGVNGEKKVILSAEMIRFDTDGNEYVEEVIMNSFATLQEAFNEIDKIAAPTITYRIKLAEDDTALKTDRETIIDYTLPTKASAVTVYSDDYVTLTYSKTMKIKSNVTFEKVILNPKENDGEIALDKYILRLDKVDFEAGNVFGISGSGVGKGSELVLAECDAITISKLSGVDTVVLASTDLVVEKDTKVGSLVVDGSDFTGLGKIEAVSVSAPYDNARIVTAPKVTVDKNTNLITKTEPTMTITGELDGEILFELSDGTVSGRLEAPGDFANDMLSADGVGIAFVKAAKASPESVQIYETEDEVDTGYVYKKSGVFVYKDAEPQVMLGTRTEEDGEGHIRYVNYETFADAVKEIDSLKTKQDYEIVFRTSSEDSPIALTMPKAGMVNTLTLSTADDLGEVYYIGDITLNSNVVLSDINFVQMTKVNNEYELADTAMYLKKSFASPVKVKVNGAYSLDFDGTVCFNTFIALDGASKKATLNIDGEDVLLAYVDDTYVSNQNTPNMFIQGTVKDFKTVNVNGGEVAIEGYFAGNPNDELAKWTYKAAEVNVDELNITNSADVKVGRDVQTVDAVTIKNLSMSDGYLTSCGTTSLTNVTLSGATDEIVVDGQKFTISGTLTSATTGAYLQTVVDAKKYTSVLDISGNVVLEKPENKITVAVMDPDNYGNEPIDLGRDTYYDKDNKSQTYGNKLLSAQKADISVFRADLDCGEYVNGEQDGYILKKSGKDILVYYSEDVEVALYTDSNAENLYNYYTSFNEAVAVIDAFKKTDAEYAIEVLNDVGSSNAYEKVSLPSKAASVTIYSENGEAIYYNSDLTLGCNTTFENVKLVPMISGTARKGIDVKGFELTFDDILLDETIGLGKITGDSKTAKVTFKTSAPIMINGDLTKVVNVELYNTLEEAADVKPSVNVIGKTEITNLTYLNGVDNESVIFDARGKAVIKNVYSKAASEVVNELCYSGDLTISGIIETDNDTKIKLNSTIAKAAASYDAKSPAKLVLNNDCKLASIERAALTDVEFYIGDLRVEYAVWSGKAVYKVPTMANVVTVYDKEQTELATCVDISQAAAYIETVADKTADYVIGIDGNILDTAVTDTTAVSKLTLPKKDVAASVTIDGDDETGSIVSFTDDITANGIVTLKDVQLKNAKDFSIANKKNSDTTANKVKVPGKAELKLDNVSIITTGNIGYVKSITGEKNTTVFTLINTELLTTAKSDVATLKLASGGAWAALGATTIGTVENSGDNTFLGTSIVSGAPQLTIAGKVEKLVTEEGESKDTNKTVTMKLYDFTTKNAYTSEANKYEHQPLVIAKAEAADKFVAEPFVDGQSVDAYKDAKNYVYNGDISQMDVKLLAKDKTAEDIKANWTITYAKTYADAITIINNTADPDMDYKIELLRSNSSKPEEGNVFKTTVDKNGAAYGALALPKAKSAHSLTIKTNDKDNKLTVKYTGTIKPACDLIFENVILTEGKAADTKVESDGFAESYSVTPELGSVNITFGEGTETLNANVTAISNIADDEQAMYALEEDATYSLVFSKIASSKGSTLNIAENAAYVMGDATVNSLYAEQSAVLSVKGKATVTDILVAEGNTVQLNCKNAIALTNISGSGELAVKTSYTVKDWKKGSTQFSIAGELEKGTALTFAQYVYDQGYRLLNRDEAWDILLDPEDKPAAYQKLITAPKLQISEDVTLITNSGMDYYGLYKYDGGVYLTTDTPCIEVVGSKLVENENNEEELIPIETYRGSFFTWDQAVKEIDKLNHAPSKTDAGWDYKIILHEDLGAYHEPIKSLTMPAKANSVTIVGGEDYYYNGEQQQNVEFEDIEGIMLTETSISLKTDLDIRVPIVSVKMSGERYYVQACTLNAGNYNLTLTDIPNGADFDGMGWYEPQIKVSGSAKGSVTVNPGDDVEGKNDTNYTGMITQISGIGTATLGMNMELGENVKYGYYEVPSGISNVTTLILEPGVIVNTKNTDVSVKNLVMGKSVEDEEVEGNRVYDEEGRYVNTYISNPLRSRIEAKNITVSDTLTMASSKLKAGTSVAGDGKITLTNVVLQDNHNNIEGKQDKNGKSQIQIKGTVSAEGNNINAQDGAITIGLYYNNSSQRFVQLSDGMTLLTAPKAASSWFNPCYNGDGYANMGDYLEGFGMYKSGNDINYGLLADNVEARVWIGGTPGTTSYMEFKTFEEAVKAIDSMGLQDNVTDEVTGKTSKVYKDYFIELVTDVNIGNDKGDGKFTSLSLPAKASKVVILGYGNTIKFSGNVSLKCTTVFDDLNLVPMKAVKGDAIPTTTNIAIGNYQMAWINSNCDEDFGNYGDLSACNSYINNITGGAKGELIIDGTSKLRANNITGLNAIRFMGDPEAVGPWDIADEVATYADYNENCGQILTTGNVTIKELRYEDNVAALLRVQGNLTTNVIYMIGECNAQIWKFDDKLMKVNGVTSYTVYGEDSEEIVKGSKSVVNTGESTVKVKTVATKAEFVAPGTKILSGKYLNVSDWSLHSFITSADNHEAISAECNGYLDGDALYIGTEFK